MNEIEYTKTVNVSDFELQMVTDFRSILKHGYGRLEVVVHNGRVTGYEPHKRFELEKLRLYQEAK